MITYIHLQKTLEQCSRTNLMVEIALYSLEVESRTKLFQTWIQKDNSKLSPSSNYVPHLQESGFKTSYKLEALLAPISA